MPAPLSLDIRKRIVAAVEGGTSRLVRELIAQAPDQTLYELRDRLAESWRHGRSHVGAPISIGLGSDAQKKDPPCR
jgi:hypothetical protein